jgi:perosamine synthetase
VRAPLGLSSAYVDERDEELVLTALRSRQLASGPMTERFEHALAERVGAPRVVAVSSGTAALHLAVRLVGVEPGDEVVTSPFSFIASANAILYEGGVPVFVDVDPTTLNVDAAAVEAAVTPQTRALLPISVFGYPLDYDRLHDVSARRRLPIVEDAAEALGATYRGRPVGSFGHTATFAFYPNKQMTTGEGGAVAIATDEDWELVKSLANQGRGGTGLLYDRLGYNYRMDELSAALGVAQLEKLDRLLAGRDRVASRYNELLADVEGVTTLCPNDAEHVRSWFVYVVFLDEAVARDAVMERLGAAGIASRPYFPAIHLQPVYRERFGFGPGMLPVAEKAGATGLALPFHTTLSEAEQERVARELGAAVGAG